MSKRFRTKRKKGSKVDQALRLAKANRKAIKSDLEYVETDLLVASAAMNATPVVSHIAISATGGNKIMMKSLQLQGLVLQNLASALNDEWRVDLVLDRNPQGALPTVVEMYDLATPQIYAYRSFENRRRFKVLRSWRGVFEGSTKTSEVLDAYIKLNLIAEADDGAFTTIAPIFKNALVLVRWTTATANQPTFEGITRIVHVRDA